MGLLFLVGSFTSFFTLTAGFLAELLPPVLVGVLTVARGGAGFAFLAGALTLGGGLGLPRCAAGALRGLGLASCRFTDWALRRSFGGGRFCILPEEIQRGCKLRRRKPCPSLALVSHQIL